jgi:hypothetical protein
LAHSSWLIDTASPSAMSNQLFGRLPDGVNKRADPPAQANGSPFEFKILNLAYPLSLPEYQQ